MTSTTTRKQQLEVLRDDQTTKKWCVLLRDDVFKRFIKSQGNNPTVQKVFGDGSLFSPFLFGNFFDPSDAFPLWEFESDVLLCNLRSSGQSAVDWSQTDQEYLLKADQLQGIGKNGVEIVAESEKVVEISGLWNNQKSDLKTKDWRSCNWWEYGFVRKLELPEDADWRKIEAFLTNDTLLEIKIPKKSSQCCDGNAHE
ncbi:hypothetical protein UlMin_003464 [Ulmus minor]